MSLQTGRHRTPVLLTAHIVIGAYYPAAILRRVEARLAFRPNLTFGAIRRQLLLSLAELRRNGKVLRDCGRCSGPSRRWSRRSLRKCRQRRCAQQQDQGYADDVAR